MIFIFAMSALGVYGLKFQNFGNYANSNFGMSMGFNDVQETHAHKSLTNVKPMGADDWVTEKSIGKNLLALSETIISLEKMLNDIGSTRWILQDGFQWCKQFFSKKEYFENIYKNFKDTEKHKIDEDFDTAVKLFDNLQMEADGIRRLLQL